jgi:hypothetical protein
MGRMDTLDKIPTWLKAAAGIGALLMGPIMVLAFWLAGTRGGIVAVLSIIVYFTTLYIVGIRKYVER